MGRSSLTGRTFGERWTAADFHEEGGPRMMAFGTADSRSVRPYGQALEKARPDS